MGARARGLAAVRRRGGVRVRDLPRGLVERLRAGRPGHHPAEPASGLAIRALARLPRAILAPRSRGTPLSPARRPHLCTRRAGGRRALVPLREPAVARGWERRRGRVGAAVDRPPGPPCGRAPLSPAIPATGGPGPRRPARRGGCGGGFPPVGGL